MSVSQKIWHKFEKLRLQPIRVFVFHHVSAERDPLVCQEEDWTQLDQFKQNIEKLRKQYSFISLFEAYHKLQHNLFRFRRYAVLTTDDGLASVLNVIPWLEKHQIPLTLFVNTRYMDGDKLKPFHKKWLHELAPNANEKKIAEKMYLSKEQIWALNSPYIEIGMHGHEHLNAQQIKEKQFELDYEQCEEQLRNHPRYMNAYAYPWGKESWTSLCFLEQRGTIPIVLKGKCNYTFDRYIDRECIDNIVL